MRMPGASRSFPNLKSSQKINAGKLILCNLSQLHQASTKDGAVVVRKANHLSQMRRGLAFSNGAYGQYNHNHRLDLIAVKMAS
jgi:hypothetical protein